VRSRRRAAGILASIAAIALVTAACTGGSGAGSAGSGSGGLPSGVVLPGVTSGTARDLFRYAYEQDFTSYNDRTVDAASSANGVILDQVLRGFSYVAPDGTLTPDTEFGSFAKVSDNPLTVRYTFAPQAVWSDGNPLDCDDAVMVWLANSGTSGVSGWSSADTSGYSATGKPVCKDGDTTFTVTYRQPYADWAAQYSSFLPAHLVERYSGVPDLITAADQPTGPQSLKAAVYYNTAWKVTSGQFKPELMPSAGPYAITGLDFGRSITLTANPRWWGRPPRTRTVLVEFMAADAMVNALINGQIDAMDPQPRPDLLTRLRGAGSAVTVTTPDQFTFEHLDFNFRGLFRNRNLRAAFAKCLPRQQIVDTVVRPQNPNAQVLQSRFVLPFQSSYLQVAAGTGAEAYTTVDVAAAKRLVDGSGVKAPIQVRIGWQRDPVSLSTRRINTIALIQASCQGAGFDVVDAGTPDFFIRGLPDGAFDAALFGWTGSPLVHQDKSRYGTGGALNNDAYSNPAVDTALDQLVRQVDPVQRTALLRQLDTLMWTDLQTIPLFALPGLVATAPGVQGVQFNPAPSGLAWNAYDWAVGQSVGQSQGQTAVPTSSPTP
jgi:peptide/nickel transport system substrate-binding protein